MIYRYLRYSTSAQDERQQANTIDKYLHSKGMKADRTFTDEATHGYTNYTKRNLFDLCNEIQEGDILVLSEISRLTRSGIGELSEIIEKYFKPNKLRLIICNVGLDVDCSDLNPLIEMQLMMMATFAKIERTLIVDRVKSAHEVRKKQIAEQGFFINKRGEKITSYASAYGKRTGGTHAQSCEKARAKRAENMRKKAQENPHNVAFADYVSIYEEKNGYITPKTDITQLTNELNRMKLTTATGLPFDNQRTRSMLNKVRKIYVA